MLKKMISGDYRAVIFLVVFFFLFPGVGRGASGNPAQVLELGAGAALPAMGGAGQASVRGPAALHYNPAGLAYGNNRELEITYQSMVEGINYGNIDLNQKFTKNIAGAAGIRYLSYGSVNKTGLSGEEVVDIGSFKDVDYVFSGGLGWKFGNFSLGAALRSLQVELAGETEKTRSFDLGLQYYSMIRSFPVSMGLTVQNMGNGIKFNEETEKLPEVVRTGASLFLQPVIEEDVRLHADIEHRSNNSETYLHLGGEWIFEDITSLRLGYDRDVDIDNGLTYGFGFTPPGYKMKIDYALLPYGDFGNLHRLTLTYYLP